MSSVVIIVRAILGVAASVSLAFSTAQAQRAAVSGQVVLRDNGEPLGFATISVLPQGTQLLTNESGKFALSNLPPGEVHFRFKRIGFVPKDTVFTIAANDTARIRIEMTRLAIELPAVVVNGACTNETPFERKPAMLAELFDQVHQNAERMKLLATARPFVMQTVQIPGYRYPDKPFVPIGIADTAIRGPLPVVPYRPKHVLRRGEGRNRNVWMVMIPELADFADTAFTNNHCLRYAGQTRFASDSVIAVDFEPVPRLAKEADVAGTMYLRVDGYQLVGVVARLSFFPPQYRHIQEYTHRTRFRESVAGIPVLVDWELVNVFRNGSPPVVAIGRVVEIRWTDSTAIKPDR